MKWIESNQPADMVQRYQLIENNTQRVELHYQPVQQSLRIYSGEKQEVFFIKPGLKVETGFKITNSYGFDEGMIHLDPKSGHALFGHLNISDHEQHFSVHYKEDDAPDMVTYAADIKAALVHCKLPALLTKLHKEAAISVYNIQAALIWSFHWWLLTVKPVRRREKTTTILNKVTIA